MTEQPPAGAEQPWQPPQQGYPQQGYPQQGYPQQGYSQYTPEPPATSKATLALVLGIIGLTVCPGAASIPAWIVGNEAVKEIEASNGALGGRSLAMAGKVTGIVGTVLGVLGLLAIGAIFLFSAILVSSVDDCTGTSTDTEFSFNC